MKHRKLITNVVLSLAFLMVANFASAALPPLVPDCASGEQTKAADLNCLMEVGVNVVKLILGLSGSVVLVYFLYGGFLWLTAAGSAERVKKGKSVVINAVIGLVIIFAAYSLVQFATTVLGVNFKKTTETVPALKK